MQSWLRSLSAKLPALQLMGDTEPATQNAPVGQLVHSDALATPLALENVPGGQLFGLPVPTSQ